MAKPIETLSAADSATLSRAITQHTRTLTFWSRESLAGADVGDADFVTCVRYYNNGPPANILYQVVSSEPQVDARAKVALAAGKWGVVANDNLTVTMFGARCDATAAGGGGDDTAAVQAGLNFAGFLAASPYAPVGVTLYGAPRAGTGRMRVTGLTVPPYVTLDFASDAYRSKRPLELNEARGVCQLSGTITYDRISTIRRGVIIKDNMVLPQVAAQIALWSGTAIAAAGDASSEPVIEKLLIVGFNRAIDHSPPTFADRPTFRDLSIDCRNGLRVQRCYDLACVENIHGWGVSTNAPLTRTRDDLLRDGVFMEFAVAGDWNKVINCFSYGWQTGTYINGCKQMQLIGVSHDYPSSVPVSDTRTGFKIRGDVRQVTIIGGHVAAHTYGVDVDCAISGSECSIVSVAAVQFWDIKTTPYRINKGVLNIAGAASVRGFDKLLVLETDFGSQAYDSVSINDISVNWDSPVAATFQNNAPGAAFDSGTLVKAAATPTGIVQANGSSSAFSGSRVNLGERMQFVGSLAPSTPGNNIPTLPMSGSAITPPPTSDVYLLSGAATLNNIFAAGSRLRRRLTLIGAPGSNIPISGSGNVVLNGGAAKTITEGVVVEVMLIGNAPTWRVLN